MIKNVIYSLITLFYGSYAFSQSAVETNNRLVYNRIEYFFNTQQTDSIYAMATPVFREQVPFNNLKMALEYFYNFGQIKEAVPVSFSQGVAGYNLQIGNKKASLFLQTDSTFHFDLFKIQDQEIPTEKKEIVKSVVQKTNPLDEYVDSIARTYIQKNNAQALAIGIIHQGKINTFYYGETAKGDSLSMPTAQTLFELGSITKVFTASLLANLVENDLVSLDDSITKFLPDSLRQNKHLQQITFKNLANHTSGLPKLPSNLAKVPNFNPLDPYANYGRKELFAYLKDVKLEHEPGENFEYSNTGFALLGELIELITQKTYSQYLAETITQPLGMLNTVTKIEPKTQQLAKVYDNTGAEVPTWQWQSFAAAGALKSTVADMLRFAQTQFKMPDEKIEQAFALTRQFTYYLPPNTDIGLAWHMNMTNGVVQYWHNGKTGGSSSYLALVPDSKSAIVVLANSALSVDQISTEIMNKVIESN